MATTYKAYENEDGTVEFVREGSIADQGLSAGSEEPSDVPALEQTVSDSGSLAPVEPSFIRALISGAENVNLTEPTRTVFTGEADYIGVTSDWKHDESGIIPNFDGLVEVHVQVVFWTAGTTPIRAAPIAKATLDGEPGKSAARHTYIRSASGHNNASATLVDLFEVKAGQILSVSTEAGAAAGVVNIEGGSSFLYVKRLK